MPKKADTKSSAKPEVKKKVRSKDDELLTEVALREAVNNGFVKEGEVVQLDLGETRVGYGAVVCSELFTRIKELTVPGHQEQIDTFLDECEESLREFLGTLEKSKDPDANR